MNLNTIREHLQGRRILAMPYCHADHAWEHSRDWHLRRYSSIFDRVLHLLRTQSDFRFFFDSWSEMLKPCLEARPADLPFVRQMIAERRLAIVGGQWSNVRPAQVADETFIRNMVYGRRQMADFLPDVHPEAYANMDTGIGHSQLPQVLRLGGYRRYFAWRPQRGLDEQGVPRSFIWRGLSGDTTLVTRHSYQGWFHAEEFHAARSNPRDFSLQHVDFHFLANYTWENYLAVPAAQPGLKTLSFCVGGDDQLPFVDAFFGFERDIPGIVERWNREGLGELSFGTPNDVFDILDSQRDSLPTWDGALDPTEVCYNIARNGKKGVWWLRELADRELILAEHWAARASTQGHGYPAERLDTAWRAALTFDTHAIEFLFDNDYDAARLTMDNAIHQARTVRTEALRAVAAIPDTPLLPGFTVFNPLP
ncbi:MAG: hypothetical protein PHR35_13890, partial [Kiritimatiellae bacterium]|nr:hypothetical protein [Kiritimatiellia bacterium]